MGRGARQRSQEASGPADQEPRDRTAYQLCFTEEFKESARDDKSLGLSIATAAAEEFFKLWQQVEFDDALARSRFRYETLQRPKAKAVRLKQVYIGGRKEVHRAALIVVSEGELAVWFVLTYNKRRQNASIDAAADIAAAVRGGRR